MERSALKAYMYSFQNVTPSEPDAVAMQLSSVKECLGMPTRRYMNIYFVLCSADLE
jgi:hypothetical protein